MAPRYEPPVWQFVVFVVFVAGPVAGFALALLRRWAGEPEELWLRLLITAAYTVTLSGLLFGVAILWLRWHARRVGR